MAHFDVLDGSVDVHGFHFLEASAGTGKTFAIEHIFIRLLVEGERPLLPQEIVVMTFTRAAARELKERIYANCVAVKEQLEAGASSLDYVRRWLDAGKAGYALKQLRSALGQFERARISTLHSFCARALSENALDCGVPFTFSEIEERTWKREIEECIERWLPTLPYPRYAPVQLDHALRACGGGERLVATLAKLYAMQLAIEEYPTFDALHQKMRAELLSCERVQASALVEDFERLAPLYKQCGGPAFCTQVRCIGTALEERECSLSTFEEWVGQREWFFPKLDPQFRKKRAQDDPRLHYPGLLFSLKERIYPWIAQAADAKRIVLRMVKEVSPHIEHALALKGVLLPDAMVRTMREALEEPRFAERIRKEFRAAIIDEFQDTDDAQWEIVQKLFSQTLYLVGDPKQSIYAFRNADLYTYMAAKDALGPHASKELSVNFRSSPKLVSALNALFAHVRSAGGFPLPRGNARLPIPTVRAGLAQAQDDAEALHFFCVQADSGRARAWPSLALEKQYLFPFIAEEIERQRIPFETIAILVKDRHQARRVGAHLQSVGIASHCEKGVSLSESRALFLLKECVKAVLAPEDIGLVKSLLAGPLAGWDAPALAVYPKTDVQEGLHALQRALLQEGHAAFFGDLLKHTFSRDGQTVEECLGAHDEELYAEMRSIIALCCEELLQREVPLLSLLQELERRDAALPVRDGGSSVQILTMHMSKGLEFDTVFALGVASRHTLQDDWIKVGKQLRPLEPEAPDLAPILEESAAEKLRLAYVALTRAKRKLYVPLIWDGKGAPKAPYERSANELLFSMSQEEMKQWLERLAREESVAISWL